MGDPCLVLVFIIRLKFQSIIHFLRISLDKPKSCLFLLQMPPVSIAWWPRASHAHVIFEANRT
jgi:hypothetical protein